MTDKIVRSFYNALSLAVHFCVIVLIFSIPVLFAVKADAPLRFSLNGMEVREAAGTDSYFAETGGNADGWYRVDYDMDVAAARLTPYSYTVESFALQNPCKKLLGKDCGVFLDAPLEFDGRNADNYILTLYIRANSEEDAQNKAKEAAFGTRGIVRKFSVFDHSIEVNVPGFSVGELL